MAERYQYIMVAPDSFSAALWPGWHVPTKKEAPNPDVLHALACLDYVMNLKGVKVNLNYVTTAGVSNGGYMAVPMV